MTTKWFYKLMGEEIGPLTLLELRSHVGNGHVEPDTHVRAADSDDWRLARSIPELRAILATPISKATQVPINRPTQAADDNDQEEMERREFRPSRGGAPKAALVILVGLGLSMIVLLTMMFAESSSTNTSDSSGAPPAVSEFHSSAPIAAEKNLVSDWNKFVNESRSRQYLANENYVRRFAAAERIQVDWGVNDLVKSESISEPYVGKIDLTIHLISKVGTGRYLYSLQFIPNGGSWKYRGGKKQRFDSVHTDPAPIDYPALEDEVSALFAQ